MVKAINILELIEAVSEGGFKLNIATLPLTKARAYAEAEFEKAGKDLNKEIPNFDKNYIELQKACKKAIDIPRKEMPVIEPKDFPKFKDDLGKGQVDIFAPYAKGKLFTPKGLEKNKKAADEWIVLGFKDNHPTDDKIKAIITREAANKLLPSQSQIWLEKLVGNIIKFGLPITGSSVTEATVISSSDGYILDGHHRYGQAMLANPGVGMKTLVVPVDVKTLIKVGRSYGNALGNKQKA